MSKIFSWAAFEARRAAKQRLATNPDGERFIEDCRRKWREADKRAQLERTRELFMELEAQSALAAYCETFGRNAALTLWDELRATLMDQPLIPEKDWA